jgi:hypothetical protein
LRTGAEQNILTCEGGRGGRLGKIRNEELHNMYAARNIIRVIKSRRMRWAEHLARIVYMRNAPNISVGKPEGRDHFEDLAVDGKITLEWILGA